MLLGELVNNFIQLAHRSRSEKVSFRRGLAIERKYENTSERLKIWYQITCNYSKILSEIIQRSSHDQRSNRNFVLLFNPSRRNFSGKEINFTSEKRKEEKPMKSIRILRIYERGMTRERKGGKEEGSGWTAIRNDIFFRAERPALRATAAANGGVSALAEGLFEIRMRDTFAITFM